MRIRPQKGQTLIEVLFAIVIFAVAVLGSVVLARTSTRANTEAGRRTQASALATLEYEKVRQYRDEKVQRGTPWDDIWPNIVGCATFVMEPGFLGQPWRYESASNPQNFDTTTDPGQSFKRIVRMCNSHEVRRIPGVPGVTEDTYTLTVGQKVKTVEVRVEWQEAGGPTRTVIYRSALSSEEKAAAI